MISHTAGNMALPLTLMTNFIHHPTFPFSLSRFTIVLLALFSLAASIAPQPCDAAPPPVAYTPDQTGSLVLAPPHLEVAEDPTGTLELEAMLGQDANFRPSRRDTLNFGFSHSAWWVRFSIANPGEKGHQAILEVDFPLIDHVALYCPDPSGGYRVIRAGELEAPAAQRSSRTPSFLLNLPPSSQGLYYLRYQDKGSVSFSLKLWPPRQHELKTVREGHAHAFYYCVLLAIALYMLLVYRMLRVRTYLLYVLYILCLVLWQMAYNGILNLMIWPRANWINNHAIPLLICATAATAIVFTRDFLNTRQHAPRSHRWLTILLVLFACAAPLSLLPNYGPAARVSALLAIVLAPSVISIGFLCWRKGYRAARYFTIAWFALLSGTLALGLKSFGLLPSVFWTEYGQHIGSLLEVILLSLALVDQVTLMKAEKDKAQKLALTIQKQSHEKLEEQVRQRTRELQQSNLQLQTLSAKLSKYLSPQLYHSIFTGQQDVVRQAGRKKLTIFFSDLEGFTELSDTIESEDLTGILNTYLTRMTEIALDHGGTLDKFIGDAVMVFFGDPETRGVKEDAVACVRMAMAMRQALRDLPTGLDEAVLHADLHVRMGINTGFCTVGNFGAENRLDYTIIGSQVNLASRLESIAGQDQILISQATHDLVKDSIRCRRLGEIQVKGIAHPVGTFEVLGPWEPHSVDGLLESSGNGFSIRVDLGAIPETSAREALRFIHEATERIEKKLEGGKSDGSGCGEALSQPTSGSESNV